MWTLLYIYCAFTYGYQFSNMMDYISNDYEDDYREFDCVKKYVYLPLLLGFFIFITAPISTPIGLLLHLFMGDKYDR